MTQPLKRPAKKAVARKRAAAKAPKAASPKQQTKGEVEQAALHLHELRTRAKDLADDIKEAQQTVLDLMEASGAKSLTFKDGERRLKVTKVQNETEVIDQPKLKKRLGGKVWDKITTKALDKQKLAAYMKTGEVKAADVAACSTTKESSAFIKIT